MSFLKREKEKKQTREGDREREIFECLWWSLPGNQKLKTWVVITSKQWHEISIGTMKHFHFIQLCLIYRFVLSKLYCIKCNKAIN